MTICFKEYFNYESYRQYSLVWIKRFLTKGSVGFCLQSTVSPLCRVGVTYKFKLYLAACPTGMGSTITANTNVFPLKLI